MASERARERAKLVVISINMIVGIDASRANLARKTGVEWYSYHLINELKKIPLLPGDNFVLYSPAKLLDELGVLPSGWKDEVLFWSPKYLWTQIRLSVKTFFRPPDTLFVPAHALPVFSRAKNIITLHDLGFERFPEFYSLWHRIYLRFVYRFAARHAKIIIAPSEFTKKELIELYKIKPDLIKVVYLGYDKNLFHPLLDHGAMKKFLIERQISEPYLLYIGRLEKKKNIKNLIEAFLEASAENKKLKLVLVGAPGYGYEEFGELIGRHQNSIIHLPHLTHREISYLYSRALSFIFPSWYEGFGLPLLEAMACGCPVLASSVSSIPEVAGEAALYFDPHDKTEMAAAIKKIVIDSHLRQELIGRGWVRVKNFSWQKCAQETYQILTGRK